MTANKNVKATIANKKDIYYIIIGYYLKDGTRKQKWIKTDLCVSGNNKRKIENKRIEILQEWQDKILVDRDGILFSAYLKQWLEETKHTISKSTYYSYKQTIHNSICPYFDNGKLTLHDLSPYHLQSFYAHKMENDNVTANTIHHYHANIHKALNYAVKSEQIPNNPADKVELPKKKKHIAEFYTATELKILLNHIKGTQIETVVMLATWFGLRRGEIVGIKWSDIDFDNKILYITGTVKDKGESGSKIKNLYYEASAKTSSSLRSFPMSDFTIEYLKNLFVKQQQNKLKENYNHKWDNFVCVRDNGDLIPLEYISRVFPRLCQKAGLKRLRLHELRHTNISLLLEAGASIKELQEWAGHSSYSTTANIYSHIQAQTKAKLTETLEKIIC